ncbi:TolC family outer membrane protein [Rubellimicrobium aerolatum]|uniref:TolC family outer membrane protein n=1 Tax=Rubellimicrobium aerolatum TaxID=490979 RepID=A0ABW0SCF3_9RHOB|nr:TolC family outer membrane protein [Rubellimicrobium aerolatum]MBP1806211.1 outer membrane protein [Rubellimicrobium aerolatum]
MRHIFRGTVAALALWAGTAQAETLADALVDGYNSSGLIEQNRATLRAADENVAQAVATLRPVLSWSASLERSFTSAEVATAGLLGTTVERLEANSDELAVGLSLTQTLWDSGARRLAIEAQKETVLATRESLRDIERQVLLRIVSAYQEVRRARAFVGLRENNVRVIGEELRAAQDRFEVGEVTRTDVALAEAELAAARSNLVAAQGDLATAIEDFRAFVGRAPGDLEPPPFATIPSAPAEAEAIALRSYPELLQVQHQVAAAEIAISATRAQQRPTVALSGGISLSRESDALGELAEAPNTGVAQVGVSVEGPIYRGGAGASEVRQSRAQRDEARASLIEVSRGVVQAVGTAYANLEVARASRSAFSEQVRAAQIAFEGVREEATLGARTTLDVLDAEQELLDARASLVDAEINEALATYQILSAAGLLSAQTLGLNVQVYDPSAYYDLVDDAPSAASRQGRALDRVLQSIGQGN